MKERKVKKMNTSSESAEQIVRLSLQGMEVALRISGSATKNIAALLVAIAKDQEKVKGKTNITSMLKSGKPLKVFCVKEYDLKKFSEEAKRYGVLYSVIVDKNTKDGMVDIMVREEDASKINRIIERFKLATVDLATVKSEVEKIKEAKEKETESKDNETKESDKAEETPIKKEENENTNPSSTLTEKKNPSENSSKSKSKSDPSFNQEKPSVREELKQIKQEQEAKEKSKAYKTKVTEHKQPTKKKVRSKKVER